MSQGIRFLSRFSLGSDDLNAPGLYVISATTTADGDFNKRNLVTNSLREKWRSGSIVSPGYNALVIEANDLTDPIDTFALLNHNLSEDAVITLKGSSTTDFTSAPFSVTLEWNEKNIVWTGTTIVPFRYYEVRIVDATNPCGYIEIGKIIGGVALVMTGDEDITDDFSISTDDRAYKMESEGFFRASNETVLTDTLSVSFDRLDTRVNTTNYLGLKALTTYVRTTIPFLTILDPEEEGFFTIWGQLTQLPGRSFGINRYSSMKLTIEEVL